MTLRLVKSAALGVMPLLICAVAMNSVAMARDGAANGVAVKGEVTLATAELCVVKDAGGKGVMMQIDKGTSLEGTIRIGAQVEAVVASDGRAISIRTLKK